MPPLTPEAQRLRIIILSFPLFVGTSYVLYKRGRFSSPILCSGSDMTLHLLFICVAFLGEEQRRIPRTLQDDKQVTERISILGRGVGVGGLEDRQNRPLDKP